MVYNCYMAKAGKNNDKNTLVIFQAKNGAIELRGDFSRSTIWATQRQMADLFGVDVRTVNEHIKNIFKSKELEKDATIRKFRIVRQEGKRMVVREIEHYNLDMIIFVGYRVNSKTATAFRIWATKILKNHITKGYTINKRLLRKKQKEAQKLLQDLQELVKGKKLVGAGDVLELVRAFSDTWFNLESYDKNGFPEKGFTKKKLKISAKELYEEIQIFKNELIKKGEATELFAQEKTPNTLEGILGNVFQAAFGKELYPTVEEKAAHLLYFIIKNHPFNDGNKRTGAFAFVWFLQKAHLKTLSKITPETLTALSLLVAESDPKDKEKMIGITLLLLKK